MKVLPGAIKIYTPHTCPYTPPEVYFSPGEGKNGEKNSEKYQSLVLLWKANLLAKYFYLHDLTHLLYLLLCFVLFFEMSLSGVDKEITLNTDMNSKGEILNFFGLSEMSENQLRKL